jgi:sterol desaturase/sphingolipid hydroxylase (fatty acid hydroxylase superfamily)
VSESGIPALLGAYLEDVGTVLIRMPLEISEKFYFVYVITFIGLAYFSYRRYYKHRTRRNFWQFLFPSSIYLARSARVDYAVFLINILLSPLLLVGAGLQALISTEIAAGLVGLNSDQAVMVGDWGVATYAVFILGYTLVADFSVYLIHRLHHANSVLWPLHSLHHSAQVMTPVTLFRKHPVWNVLSNLLNLTMTGLFQGVFVFVFFGNPGVEILFGLNTVYIVYNFFGANLRHSHVWLSWGKPLSYFFISPAMHQIHHDPKRMHKNYGEMFAIWDWMFGTLYVPQSYEQFEIGLGDEGNPHDTVMRAYTVPIMQSCGALLDKLKALRRK